MDSFGGLIHKKKKEAKKKNNKSHMANVQMPYVQMEGSTHDSKVNSTNDTKGISRQPERLTKQRKDVEIDQFLQGLVRDGLVDIKFISWHAKCIYTLGIERYNIVVIDARGGNSPMRLLAYKLKGAMQLHYKQQFDRERYGVGEA